MTGWPRKLPPLLAKLHQLNFYAEDGEEIDFEPYQEFLPAEENSSWFKAWTGNSAVDGAQFRVFGQDGTGGYAALWIANPGQPLEAQPIVFLGSEGEKGVIALNVDEYLWLLAAGTGPYEAVAYPGTAADPKAQFAEFARKNSKASVLQASEVLARANAAHLSFEKYIDDLCR
jgi:hypothetical protein